MQHDPLSLCSKCTAASNCWLTGLELLTTQPACLRAHPHTPQQQQLQHDQQEDTRHELKHELLLHIRVVLEGPQTAATRHAPTVTATEQAFAGQQLRPAATAADPSSPPLPLLLPDAQLELLMLGRQMQVIHQQRVSLLQLLLRQQQPQHDNPQVVLMSAEQCTELWFAPDTRPQDSETVAASHSYININSSSSCSSSSSSGSSSHSWSVCLNLHISMPCLPTEQLLDCLHLLLMVSSSSSSSSNVGGTAAAAVQRAPAAAAAGLVAEVPLLVMPAPAQQEVQQLLLPAMRQEVQAGQQQRQQQQHGHEQFGDVDFASQAMEVEQAAWRHFCQLAHDLYAVMQLSEAVVEAEAAAAAAEAAASAAAASGAAGGHADRAAAADDASSSAAAPAVRAAAPLVALVASQEAPTPAAAAAAPGPADALAQLADTVLFPLMLPFLAAHGLHNTLALLLSCLPLPLQLQWQQQQLARLQELTNMGAPAVPPPVQDQQQNQHHQEGMALKNASRVGLESGGQQLQQQQQMQQIWPPSQQQGEQQQDVLVRQAAGQQEVGETFTKTTGKQAAAAAAVAAAGAGADLPTSSKGVEKPADAGAVAAISSTAKHPLNQKSSAAASTCTEATAAAAAAGCTAAAGVPWYLPLTQLSDGDMEQRYLAWKNHTLLHLDYLCALFDVMYLTVVLRRMLSEPTTLWYFLYIMVKTLPHVPLMLGMQRTFLRHRELWLFLVAPVNVLMTLCLVNYQIRHGQPALLLPNKAYKAYWNSRGELPMAIMRPFLQHMRLRPYTVYSLWDAGLSVWVLAQVFEVWEAIRRFAFAAGMSIVLCWCFELHMRRRFANRQLST